MQQVYEQLIQPLLDKGFGSVDGWFSGEEIAALRQVLLERYQKDEFHQAGIGQHYQYQRKKRIRGDQIKWIAANSPIAIEQHFLKQVNDFIDYLNRTCFAGIRNSEFHYAVYEPGTFYKRHSDQFNRDDRRRFSMVLYLHENWNPGDGGELIIYGQENHCIEPLPGRIVFFSSELEHEVLRSESQRMSLTGWLRSN
ncbi:MAG: 2OG-Fe(II) oxygenase [Bacteroidetes bacterium]|nr:MAG: 2OG-Fe(II) oxygenase [Bacteroidota bacterium]